MIRRSSVRVWIRILRLAGWDGTGCPRDPTIPIDTYKDPLRGSATRSAQTSPPAQVLSLEMQHARVTAHHTGAEFESGAVYRATRSDADKFSERACHFQICDPFSEWRVILEWAYSPITDVWTREP